MIDFILLTFVLGVFYGGFYCGNKFKTLQGMWTAAKELVK